MALGWNVPILNADTKSMYHRTMGKEERVQNAPYVAGSLGLMEDAIRAELMNEPHLKI